MKKKELKVQVSDTTMLIRDIKVDYQNKVKSPFRDLG